MNMKFNFKIGDRVKLKHSCSGSDPKVVYTLIDKAKDGSRDESLWAWNKKTRSCGCCCLDNFILQTKMAKEKPIKYILKYDVSNGDPWEEFATLDEVKKRIEHFIEEGDGVILGSVRVYEVKSVAKVETQIVFTK